MSSFMAEPPPPGLPTYPPPQLNPPPVPPPGPSKPQTPNGLITLIVKHVPTNIEPGTLQEVFKCVGAVAVRPCNAEGKLRGVVFVDFVDAGQAAQAKDQLHGLKLLNKTLAAEFARPQSHPKPPTDAAMTIRVVASAPEPPPGGSSRSHVTPSTGVFSGPVRAESIAPGLKLDYPFPPGLRYQYPPPDAGVLRNIQSALISVPRFYTQVLHLMNKMNLPPPFASVFPPPPSQPQPAAPSPAADVNKAGLLTSAISVPPEAAAREPALNGPDGDVAGEADVSADVTGRDDNGAGGSGDESESESEMESDVDELDDVGSGGQPASGKRRKDRPLEHRKKRRREPGMKALETAQVREVALGNEVREVRPRVKKTTMQINLDVPAIKARTAKLPVPPVVKPTPVPQTPKPAPQDTEKATQPAAATREQLKAGQVSQEEMQANPVFQKYAPGEPSPVLYVKNIAKEVTVEDLLHVFGAFLAGDGSSSEASLIRLMQEGRMKGQAFVTFTDVTRAQEAMEHTHGYLLKGKPLIVQFGRKAKGHDQG